MGKKIPKGRRSGPKTKAGNCRFGVVKTGRRVGHCLLGARAKK